MKRILTVLVALLMQAPLAMAQGADPLETGGADLLPAEDGLVTHQDEFLPVEEAYKLALEVTGEQQLRLFWQIEEGYYLYKKRFSFSLETADGDVEVTPTFPQGVVREDEYFGKSEVFYISADISLALANPVERGTLKISSQGCADAGLCYPPHREQFRVDFIEKSIAPAGETAPAGSAGAAGRTGTSQPLAATALLYMMLLAFIGGSILNLMPCVFPVLSLKVFSFATGSEHSKHVHGWVYALGVVSSFLLVAFILITLQQAGAAVGWGFQLQEPRFVALLAYLFFFMGLSLSGLVELGAGFMGLGSQLAERGGYSGSFFTGVLATVVASPCTAPFMGTALGFAVTQPAPVALAVFAALGSGMAAPMLLLSYSKTLRAMMPKPGPWMETFKQLLAFPLYATAIWLLWVAGRQTGVTAMAVLLCGMLALTLGLWLWRYRSWGRVLGGMAVLGALLVIPSGSLERAQGGTDAEGDWTQQRLETLLDEGRPVFVNVTADWCITCMANERSSLSNESVQAAMTAMDMAYVVVDWTDYNAEIAAFLARFGRNGVPLYLVYSGRSGEDPQVLPQLLTPGIVLDALERAEAPALAER